MLKQRTVSVVEFPAGTLLGLTKDQARARRHALQEEGNGRYRAMAPVQFKAGEEIGLEGEPTKNLASALDRGAATRRRKPATAATDPAKLDIEA